MLIPTSKTYSSEGQTHNKRTSSRFMYWACIRVINQHLSIYSNPTDTNTCIHFSLLKVKVRFLPYTLTTYYHMDMVYSAPNAKSMLKTSHYNNITSLHKLERKFHFPSTHHVHHPMQSSHHSPSSSSWSRPSLFVSPDRRRPLLFVKYDLSKLVKIKKTRLIESIIKEKKAYLRTKLLLLHYVSHQLTVLSLLHTTTAAAATVLQNASGLKIYSTWPCNSNPCLPIYINVICFSHSIIGETWLQLLFRSALIQHSYTIIIIHPSIQKQKHSESAMMTAHMLSSGRH